MESRSTQDSQNDPEQKHEAEGITESDFKAYHKAIVIKTA